MTVLGFRFVAVTGAVYRLDQFRAGQQPRKLLAQLLDVAVDGAVGNDAVVIIDAVDQLTAAEDPSGLPVQALKQVELTAVVNTFVLLVRYNFTK